MPMRLTKLAVRLETRMRSKLAGNSFHFGSCTQKENLIEKCPLINVANLLSRHEQKNFKGMQYILLKRAKYINSCCG